MKVKEKWLRKIINIEILCLVFVIGCIIGGLYIKSQIEDSLPSRYSFVSWKDGYNDAVNGFNYSYPYYPHNDPENTGFQEYYYGGYRSGQCDDYKILYFNITTQDVQNNRDLGEIITTTDGNTYKFYKANKNYEKLESGKSYTIGLTVWYSNSTNPETNNEIVSIKKESLGVDKYDK